MGVQNERIGKLGKLLRRTSFLPELGWVLGGQVAVVIAGMVAVRAFTSKMGPVGYGDLTLGLTLSALFSSVLWGPLVQTYLRLFAQYAEQRSLHELVDSLVPPIIGIAAVLGLASAAAIAGAGLVWNDRWGSLVASSALLAFAVGLGHLFEAFQLGARRRPTVAVHQAANSWIRIPVVLVCLTWSGTRGAVAVMGYALTGGLVAISQAYFFRRLIRMAGGEEKLTRSGGGRDARRAIYRQVWRFGGPLVVTSAFTWLYTYSDRWALELTTSTAAVGLYAALTQLSFAPITLLSNSALQFAQPIAFSRAGDGTDPTRLIRAHRFIDRYSVALSGVFLLLVIALWSFGDSIMRLFTPPAFWDGAHLLPWLGVAAWVNGIATMQTVVAFVHNRSADFMVISGVTGLLGVALNFLLASRFGLAGVVGAVLVAAMLRLVWSVWVARRLRPRLGIVPEPMS